MILMVIKDQVVEIHNWYIQMILLIQIWNEVDLVLILLTWGMYECLCVYSV